MAHHVGLVKFQLLVTFQETVQSRGCIMLEYELNMVCRDEWTQALEPQKSPNALGPSADNPNEFIYDSCTTPPSYPH